MKRSWKNGVEWTEKEEIKESLRQAVRAVCLSHLLSLSLARPPWRLEAQGEQSTRGIGQGNSALPSKQDLLRAVDSLLTSHRPLSLCPSLSPLPSLSHSLIPTLLPPRFASYSSLFSSSFPCCFLSSFRLSALGWCGVGKVREGRGGRRSVTVVRQIY